jgi:hypothetical protein
VCSSDLLLCLDAYSFPLLATLTFSINDLPLL